jgi:hypothetical protein
MAHPLTSAKTSLPPQAALLAGEAPGTGTYLAAGDLIMGGPGPVVPGAWMQSAGAAAIGRNGQMSGRFGGQALVGSTGMAADLGAAAPASVSASHGAGGGGHPGGDGAAMMMLDDPWEQLFGPAARPL